MRSIAFGNLVFRDCDIEIDLLEGTDMVFLSVLQVFDGPHHPSFAGEEV
jgi:hypothetical protein